MAPRRQERAQRHRGALAVLLSSVWLCACDDPAPAPKKTASGKRSVQLVEAPEAGALSAIIEAEEARALADGRKLTIYVGATWCEPCQYFKAAVKRGELDSEFPDLRLLELDRDRDEERLADVDCSSPMIPLIARAAKARCSASARMEGSIKGPGAVAEMTPRLKALLASP